MSERKPLPNGKRVSNGIGTRFKTKASTKERNLRKLLARVYSEFQRLDDPAIDKACRHDFVFHMMDWTRDLERLAELYKHPERFDKESAGKIVSGFLWHAFWHVRAAARLLLDWEPEDIFKELDGKPKRQRTRQGSGS